MGQTQAAKKASTKISSDVENRIVALSLQNPEFGAKRLAPLLQQESISVSSSTIYNILKRNGLQTRTKRLARTGPTPEKPKFISRKSTTQISDETQEQITEISLQQPDYGARRLVPLLKQHGIRVSESSVYNILKRNGLQTREKRLLALEAQQTISIPEPPVFVIPVPEEEPLPPQEITKGKALPSHIPPTPQIVAEPIAKRSNVLVFINILLASLIVFLGFYVFENISTARKKPEVKPSVFRAKVKRETSAQLLEDYRNISKRNLFNISKQKPPAPKKVAATNNIVLAGKDLGLRLVGTVVADIPRENLAIIYRSDTRGQYLYYEGDVAGDIKVKKIMRDNVIITTKQGDKRLTVKIKENRQKPTATDTSTSRLGLAEKSDSEHGSSIIHLNRKDVESSLTDIDQILAEITILPFIQNHQPAGIKLSRLPPDNILRKMGLRISDVIESVNGDPITDPEQADDFLRKLARGGDVSIYIKRNGYDRELELSIE
jgi:type II secretion system protein C